MLSHGFWYKFSAHCSIYSVPIAYLNFNHKSRDILCWFLPHILRGFGKSYTLLNNKPPSVLLYMYYIWSYNTVPASKYEPLHLLQLLQGTYYLNHIPLPPHWQRALYTYLSCQLSLNTLYNLYTTLLQHLVLLGWVHKKSSLIYLQNMR